MQKSKILITCPKGIPPFLKQELLAMNFPILSEAVAGVETEGTLDETQRLNLGLRTGHRVLFVLKEFSANDADSLYRELARIPWEEHIAADGDLCVTSSVETPDALTMRPAGARPSRWASMKYVTPSTSVSRR